MMVRAVGHDIWNLNKQLSKTHQLFFEQEFLQLLILRKF